MTEETINNADVELLNHDGEGNEVDDDDKSKGTLPLAFFLRNFISY